MIVYISTQLNMGIHTNTEAKSALYCFKNLVAMIYFLYLLHILIIQ